MKLSNGIPDFLSTLAATKENPSGTKNGTNKIFTVAGNPLFYVEVFIISNTGVITTPVFTFAVSTITFTTYAPLSTDTIVAISA